MDYADILIEPFNKEWVIFSLFSSPTFAKNVVGLFGIELGIPPNESMNPTTSEYSDWLEDKKNIGSLVRIYYIKPPETNKELGFYKMVQC